MGDTDVWWNTMPHVLSLVKCCGCFSFFNIFIMIRGWQGPLIAYLWGDFGIEVFGVLLSWIISSHPPPPPSKKKKKWKRKQTRKRGEKFEVMKAFWCIKFLFGIAYFVIHLLIPSSHLEDTFLFNMWCYLGVLGRLGGLMLMDYGTVIFS